MTDIATGANAQILIAQETDYGVAPSAEMFKKYVFKSCGLDGSQNLVENDDLGMGREALAPTLGRKSISGDISVPVDLRAIGTWFTGLLNSPITSEDTGVYSHIFSSGKENLPSFTIEKSFKEVSDYSVFNGCKVGSIDFDFQSSGNASASVSVIGKSETNNDTTIQENPTQYDYKAFSNAQAFVEIDGISADIMSGSLSLTNNIEGVETIREDNEISGVDVGMFNSTGSLSIRFTDKTLLNKAINGESVALNMGFKNSDNEKLTIKILQAHLSKPGKSIDGPGGIELSFDFQGAKNDTADKMVEIELVNDVEAY